MGNLFPCENRLLFNCVLKIVCLSRRSGSCAENSRLSWWSSCSGCLLCSTPSVRVSTIFLGQGNKGNGRRKKKQLKTACLLVAFSIPSRKDAKIVTSQTEVPRPTLFRTRSHGSVDPLSQHEVSVLWDVPCVKWFLEHGSMCSPAEPLLCRMVQMYRSLYLFPAAEVIIS